MKESKKQYVRRTQKEYNEEKLTQIAEKVFEDVCNRANHFYDLGHY